MYEYTHTYPLRAKVFGDDEPDQLTDQVIATAARTSWLPGVFISEPFTV